jgi:hypothetical protein
MKMAVKIMDCIPAAQQERFVSAADIKAFTTDAVPNALTLKNHDEEFQEKVFHEFTQRKGLVSAVSTLPQSISFSPDNEVANHVALAEQFYKFQGAVLEMPNRLSDAEFTPTPRKDMLQMTNGILGQNDPRSNTKPLFESPEDFLKAFDLGLEMWRHNKNANGFGSIGILDVAGGSGTRAAKELPKYSEYARKYGVTSKTPRALYPIADTNKTFKGVLVNVLKKISGHVGVRTPHFIMSTSETAPFITDYIRKNPEANNWGEDVMFWNQRVLQRYDVATGRVVPGFYAAGHGDNTILTYEYGMVQAMKELGIETLASSNGDEFLWYYMFPALLSKMNSLEWAMFAIAIANANNQFGGFYGNSRLYETPKLPYSFERTGKAPEVVNSTFYGIKLAQLEKGCKYLAENHPSVDIITKPTWITEPDGQKRFVNLAGFDSWMGDEFSHRIAAAGGKVQVLEASRNLFLGMKGPQHVASSIPQAFLGDYSYASFYTMMGHKVFAVLDILLGADQQRRQWLAEQLYRNNFELIKIEI